MRIRSFAIAWLAVLVPLAGAHAKSYSVLHVFTSGSDGSNPSAGLIADKNGNLYGTTAFGGPGVGCYGGNEGRGCGTVFKIAPNGAESIVHAFTGGSDGYEPQSGLVMDKTGNLYGTTLHGGGGCGRDGCGTVFKIAPDGSETVLYVFKGGSGDGANPFAGLVADKKGNLYGVTPVGGNTHTCGNFKAQQSAGCGIVFKIAPNGTETVLHVFTGGSDGGAPGANLIIDDAGNLYGTTGANGTTDSCNQELYGCGTVFKIAPNGTETLLHVFTGGSDGGVPAASLIMDDAGNLYGTTGGGGSADDCGYGSVISGCGTVFKLAPNGTETVLHVFTGGSDGAYPIGGLVADSAGNLYGTAGGGGSSKNCGLGPYGCGIVFRLASDGTETVLHVFSGKKGDGGYPAAGLIVDKKDNLYGTTYKGGVKAQHGYGTAFKLKE